ncbi:MAG: phosphate ABC transporter permease PstA [Clostridiales bacterium]|jgi:phosphate transport system permease protein|nr:phosphate ABC transporter permease PstA [Clostridiales bacterium]OPZ68248.1 MAG: Phosphate transport system permease protein PstA [Firmicutes bacterium ADurb.Bin467]
MTARRDWLSLLLRAAVWLAAGLTFSVFLSLVGYVLIRGVPNLAPELFSWKYTSDNGSMLPAIVSTALMTAISLLAAVPLGVFAAIYLTEYAGRGNRLVKAVRLTSETLAGIPSIVYGLFGYLFFLVRLKWDYSLLAGAMTLAIMILPLIMRTTEEALLSVPDGFREGSYALGAGRLRTIFRIALPTAVPGILAGVILATGRIVGETAALLYTAGTYPQLPEGLFSSVRTLSVHMYVLSSEGLHVDKAYATAAVLLVVVAGINALSSSLAKRIARGRG